MAAGGERRIGMPDEPNNWPKSATQTKATIQRLREVPSDVREAYQPVVSPTKISIGPHHHGNRSLQSGQSLKEKCHEHFLNRNPHRKYDDYVAALAPMVQELREAYDELDPDWLNEKTDEFLRMMIVDGSFLLEIMLQACDGVIGETNTFDPNEINIYRRDMLLYENQIPLKVLQALVSVQHPELDEPGIEKFLTRLIAGFFSLESDVPLELDKTLHLLSCYQRYIWNVESSRRKKKDSGFIPRLLSFFSSREKNEEDSHKPVDFYIPSAMELQEAQIRITTSGSQSLMDISFSYTTLVLPKLTVDNTTKSKLHNLILVERFLPEGEMTIVTSYVCFMSLLLKCEGDSRFLQSRHIINIAVQHNEVVELFAGLRKTISSSPNILMDANILRVGKRMRECYNMNALHIPPRIYKVPSAVRMAHDPSVFIPSKISIGPYHHDNLSLKSEQLHKKNCLLCFCNRNADMRFEDYEVALDKMVEALAPMVDELRLAYEQLDPAWLDEDKKEEFLRMMVVDGSCLLEIMLQARDGVISDYKLFDHNKMDIYRCDMLLFENQIPLKVLWALISIVEPKHDLIELIRRFFSLPQIPSECRFRHILDICRQSIIKTKLFRTKDADGFNQKSFTDIHPNILSATKLQDASIWIEKRQTLSLMDISVTLTTLRLPQIDVQDAVKSIFDKVILFEQFCPHISKCFSSYIYFMNGLLDSIEHSSLLRSEGIINTTLSDDKVVRLFRELCENIKFSPDVRMEPKFLEVQQRLSERYKKNREPWRKELLQTYLRSPWAVISVIVASIIFILSFVQTSYTVLSYYNHK